jgi:thiol:disulfide interchange protein
MTTYKHTQIGYLMLLVTLAVLVLFVWVYITASGEPKSVDSGPNFAVTAIMALILFILASLTILTLKNYKNDKRKNTTDHKKTTG